MPGSTVPVRQRRTGQIGTSFTRSADMGPIPLIRSRRLLARVTGCPGRVRSRRGLDQAACRIGRFLAAASADTIVSVAAKSIAAALNHRRFANAEKGRAALAVRILVDQSSYDLLNIGDVAMLQSCIARLWSQWPDAEIMVIAHEPVRLA